MTKRLKVTLATFALLLGVYSLLRLGFLVANREFFAGAGAGEVAAAFLHGLRFDVAALVILNAPVLFLWNLGLPKQPGRAFRTFAFVLFAALNGLGVLLNVADYGYYPNVQRRLLYEPFDRPAELLDQVPLFFREYPLLCIGVIAAVAVCLIGLRAAVAAFDRRLEGGDGFVRTTICGLLLAGFCVLGVRGGLQPGILRPADAFKHSASPSVGYLTLNTTYTVLLSAVLKPIQTVRKLPPAEASALVREMLFEEGETPLDPAYTFLRRRAPSGEPRRHNVILFILESWTWANVGPQPGGITRTPFFDSIAAQGVLYDNFLASGQKSNEAIPSILTAVPSIFRRPIIGSRVELTRFRGLGSILKENGYATSFHYGADKTIMGFDSYARMAGFDAYRSEADYPDRSAAVRDGRWGIFDELFYLDTAKWLDREAAPFAAVIFSLSPHDPYVLPKDREALFAAFAHETGYQRCLRYSDFALAKFFEYARTRPWFEDTVFVFTGDHTRFFPPNSYYEAFHVPLLLYGPGLEPAVRDEIGSHADVLPTIVDVLRLPAAHASMGRSLLPRGGERFAVVYRDQGFGFFSDRFALLSTLDRDVGLYAYREDREFRSDRQGLQPDVASDLRRRLYAYLQEVTSAVENDRVWTPPAR